MFSPAIFPVMNDVSSPAEADREAARRGLAALAAATVLNLPYGTIYAFSVFLKPVESLLGIGRADMAIVFSVASLSLTAGMVVGPRLYRLFPPGPLIISAAFVSAIGLLTAAGAQGLIQLMVGYGILFGLGGGLAFVILQQGVNQSVVNRRGLANGYVVSLYPLGAMIGAPLFGWLIHLQGLRATFVALAAVVAMAALVAAFLFRSAGIRMQDTAADPQSSPDPQWGLFARLFTVFFLAAAAGLMVMSQAAGILQAYGAATLFALGGTTLITGLIAGARIAGGWLVDRYPVPYVAAAAHGLALTGSLMLITWPTQAVALPALAMVGMGYGLVSGLTAGSIAQYWHRNAFGRVAGQIYIAWCIAAITLPVIAGWLYDRTQGYHGAMMLAAGVNLAGILVAFTLPIRARAQQ